MIIEAIDPDEPDAQYALVSYLSEAASRIAGANISLDEARDVSDFRPPLGVFLVVRDRPGVIGCGALRSLAPGVGELKRMWIAPIARGRGAGRALLDALEHAAGDLGMTTLRLDTNRSLTEAIALYERHGFRAIARYNDNPDATEFYEKTLL